MNQRARVLLWTQCGLVAAMLALHWYMYRREALDVHFQGWWEHWFATSRLGWLYAVGVILGFAFPFAIIHQIGGRIALWRQLVIAAMSCVLSFIQINAVMCLIPVRD